MFSMTSTRPHPRALLAIALVLGAFAAIPATTGAARPRAHAAASYLTGIGDEQTQMFNNPLWRQLHTKIVRYIAPYDAVAHPYSLQLATSFIRAAEAQHEQILIAFYHSEYSPMRLPSVAQYQHYVQKFVRRFPHVKQYQSWDEANRGNVPHYFSSPSGAAAARYYQALIRVCYGCTVIGLDVLDAADISGTLSYISEFKREVGRLRTVMPRIWGLHNYSDINRLESWRTRALLAAFGGQVWLTETGGLVKFGGAFPNRNGSGLSRAARVLKYMFAVAASQSQIKRLYIYNWTGGTASTRFDAGLMNARDQPRAGYQVVCRQLHGARCNARLARN
jgi:Glycosyl hydrolase catalytic core